MKNSASPSLVSAAQPAFTADTLRHIKNLLRTGQLEEARIILESLIRDEKLATNADILSLSIKYLLKTKDFQNALDVGLAALKSYPHNQSISSHIVLAYYHLDKLDEAIRHGETHTTQFGDDLQVSRTLFFAYRIKAVQERQSAHRLCTINKQRSIWSTVAILEHKALLAGERAIATHKKQCEKLPDAERKERESLFQSSRFYGLFLNHAAKLQRLDNKRRADPRSTSPER